MPEVYRWGIGIIKSIQSVEQPAFTAVVSVLTNIVYAYALVMVGILWCVDEKKGIRLGMLAIFSLWLNGISKNLLKQPRPYHLDPSVGRGVETSYGIPSGHAQITAVFAIPLAVWLGGKSGRGRLIAYSGAAALNLIAGFTRVYLGLHFPTDIFAGWLLGGLISAGYFFCGEALARLLRRGGTRVQLIAAAAAAWGMNALGGDCRAGGLFLGFCLGYALTLKYGLFSAGALTRGKRPGVLILSLRYALGLSGGVLIFYGLRLPFFGEGSPLYALASFVRYGAVGLWATAGGPLLFLRLGLAGPRETSGQEPPPEGSA
ncbi:MAG: phosphatase PAP2 family protein [Spirochaetaceae bacterium]|jgi:glycerophosphoryl diester phosphodiesterase|nr:phosphatase PAP2 family protein [Spirochaetaceae bacterium]